jgi:lysyl-tRNA synthetase class 1
MTDDRIHAHASKAWPFQEAVRLVERLAGRPSDKGYVLFETGYGPSGLPHIGTFGEVARTSMVRNAFAILSDLPTRLFAFSDDMDGLRKVPENVPRREMLEAHLGKPLTSVPDPFGTHDSFGDHNNARLRSFLDTFGFDYEFVSATDCYRSGRFDVALRAVLEHYDEVMAVILPTLGDERRGTYSPFLPICPRTGRVLQVPIESRDVRAGTVVYRDDDGRPVEVPVTGGGCKLQWKADWAMRWTALDVDYEMSGKDLIDSVRLSSRICRILGGAPPEGFTYELFLDENGEKISKSRGNGLAIEDWLRYASPESLALYMYQAPRKAKRLYFDVIPRAVDDYLNLLRKFPEEETAARLDNPVWHIHGGHPPVEDVPVTFSMLLNLASACNAHDKAVLWGFISRYAPNATPATHPVLDSLVGYAIAYFEGFVRPSKRYRAPDDTERAALEELAAVLRGLPRDSDAEAIQNEVYEVGKRHGFANLRDWFRALYEILFGQEQGPRMGSFVELYGVDETARLISRALAGEDLSDMVAE